MHTGGRGRVLWTDALAARRVGRRHQQHPRSTSARPGIMNSTHKRIQGFQRLIPLEHAKFINARGARRGPALAQPNSASAAPTKAPGKEYTNKEQAGGGPDRSSQCAGGVATGLQDTASPSAVGVSYKRGHLHTPPTRVEVRCASPHPPLLRAARARGGAAPSRQCCRLRSSNAPAAPGSGYDVVLSSGFLAFANHTGFLQAVEEVGPRVGAGAGEASRSLGRVERPRRRASTVARRPRPARPSPPRRPQAGIPVSGVMGTSAGALAGSLYAAGYSPREVRAPPRAAARHGAIADARELPPDRARARACAQARLRM